MPHVSDAPGYIGSTSGSFAIGSDGSAGYSIPIAVPPGIAGLEPKLTLAYSTGGGNGMLGLGWTLQGLSAITRCAQTLAQDGAIDTVAYGPGDRFSLDGQRLMLAAGTDYQAEDAVYHTEVESWQRVVPVYGPAEDGRGGPVSFRVQAPDGRILDYGATRIRGFRPQPGTRASGCGRCRRSRTATATAWRSATTSMSPAAPPIRCASTTPPTTRSNSRRSARSGSPIAVAMMSSRAISAGYPLRTDRLIDTIETWLDDGLVRSYRLGYAASPATGRSTPDLA